jgi:hypothetical protein
MAHVGMGSGVIAPLGGTEDAVLYLTLWWVEDIGAPGLGRLAVIRRFADQVAVALAQARTDAARDEVDALSESLQGGLLPVTGWSRCARGETRLTSWGRRA